MSQQELISFWESTLRKLPERVRKYPYQKCPGCGMVKAIRVKGLCRKCYDKQKFISLESLRNG